MRYFKSLSFRCFRLFSSFGNRLRRSRSLFIGKISGGTIDWPRSCKAAVPIRVDGTGQVILGENVILGYRPAPRIGTGEILLQSRGQGSLIRIGARTATSNNLVLIAMKSILIGEDCQIGDLVTIYDCDFHEIDPATRNRSAGQILPVNIGNNVWLGSRAMILKGVSLGDNTVVAAGSVVTKSFPSNVVVAGVPAAIVKRIDG